MHMIHKDDIFQPLQGRWSLDPLKSDYEMLKEFLQKRQLLTSRLKQNEPSADSGEVKICIDYLKLGLL